MTIHQLFPLKLMPWLSCVVWPFWGRRLGFDPRRVSFFTSDWGHPPLDPPQTHREQVCSRSDNHNLAEIPRKAFIPRPELNPHLWVLSLVNTRGANRWNPLVQISLKPKFWLA